MIVACTGHRPNKIANKQEVIKQLTAKLLWDHQPTLLLSGMAIGYDTWFVEVGLELGIPFVAYVPCEGQEALWTPAQRKHYRQLLSKAQEVKLVSTGPYAAYKMLQRNRALVKDCELLIACYNGDLTGGTHHCIKTAREQGRKVIEFDPDAL